MARRIVERRVAAGAVAATAVVFGLGVAPTASAEGSNQVVGIEQAVAQPNGEIAYTVTKILPSADSVAYPVAGQLYEATVMAKSTQGTVNPVVPFFSARTGDGANYRALEGVSSLSAAPLNEGATADGKLYFDVVGAVPNSVAYDGGSADLLTWNQPMGGGSGSSESTGGSSGGSGGSGGVMGSTGPNDVSPEVSGGEIGGEEGGTEGGGGNLDSGGGSGAPNGDTGGGGGTG